jgi:hypothetical protein
MTGHNFHLMLRSEHYLQADVVQSELVRHGKD